jgi:hypothetical protein
MRLTKGTPGGTGSSDLRFSHPISTRNQERSVQFEKSTNIRLQNQTFLSLLRCRFLPNRGIPFFFNLKLELGL